MNTFPQTGNSFDTHKISVGHARKVWREIRRQWPAGGSVTNVSDWVAKGFIPAGTPCTYTVDATGKKTIKCHTDAQVTAAKATIATLNINGYTDRDTPISSANTKATVTAVREGDLYEYMYTSEIATALKSNTKCPGVVFVN